jgi:hypothetical protein
LPERLLVKFRNNLNLGEGWNWGRMLRCWDSDRQASV